MKVLVMGGTGFISRRLVDLLIKDGSDVTIATSGRTANPFGDAVEEIKVDRFDRISLDEKLNSPPFFDIIYDMLAFRSRDMSDMIDLFRNRVGLYVFTSSASVYSGLSGTLSEKGFDPSEIKIDKPGMETNYAEGKRNCESVLFHAGAFPFAVARFPNVLGYDDSTLRFQDHLSRIQKGEKFIIPKISGKRNYVWVEDAGRFLFWLGKNGKRGAFNGASREYVEVSELIEQLGELLGVKAKIERSEGDESNTAYYSKNDYILSTVKAEKEGFQFSPFTRWLKDEVSAFREKDGTSYNSAEYRSHLFR